MTLDIRRRSLLVAATAAPLASPALAQPAWPTQPIRLMVPFPAGGGADVSVRALARTLERQNRWNIVIENRPAAGGLIGMQTFAQARPDGHNFLYFVSTFAVVDLLHDTIDMLQQAAPVAMVSRTPYLIATHTGMPFTTLGDLIEAARRQPGMLRYGHGGPGSTFDLCMKLFNAAFDLRMEAVAYRGGFAGLQGLAQGEVEVSAAIPSAVRPLEAAGRIRLLAAAQPTRVSRYPNVPTVQEAVGRSFEFSTWGGVVAQRGTSPAIVQAMFEAIGRAVVDPEYVEFARNVDLDISVSPSVQDFEGAFRSEYDLARTMLPLLSN